MAGLSQHRSHLQMMVAVLLAILIALAPISSRAINLAWILLFLVACWLLLTTPSEGVPAKLSKEVRPAIHVLIASFLAGLALQLAMRLYWDEPIQGLSFEITALAAAVVALIVSQRWQPSSKQETVLVSGLALASVLALSQNFGAAFSAPAIPTNAVNWGAGLALFMCLSVAIAVDGRSLLRDKALAFLALVAFSLTIFLAGRRGAFFAVFWAVSVGGFFAYRRIRQEPSKNMRILLPVALSAVAVSISLFASSWLLAPMDRVAIAVKEVSMVLHRKHGSEEPLRGSVAGRFHMLDLGIQATSESPWVGLGAGARDQLVKRAELDLQEPLFHLHNEYLQAWVAYGVPGLLGVLSFPMGLVVAGLLIRRDALATAVALVGLGMVHFLSGLSNVNTFHNYYGTVFAVCVIVPFLILHPTARGDPRELG